MDRIELSFWETLYFPSDILKFHASSSYRTRAQCMNEREYLSSDIKPEISWETKV